MASVYNSLTVFDGLERLTWCGLQRGLGPAVKVNDFFTLKISSDFPVSLLFCEYSGNMVSAGWKRIAPVVGLVITVYALSKLVSRFSPSRR